MTGASAQAVRQAELFASVLQYSLFELIELVEAAAIPVPPTHPSSVERRRGKWLQKLLPKSPRAQD